MTLPFQAVRLQEVLRSELPVAHFMDLQVVSWGPDGLEVRASEEPNQNLHGTAFGGSIAALALLAGWGLVWLRLRENGVEPDVVIQRTHAEYATPVRGELRARAAQPSEEVWDRFFRTLKRRKKARLALEIRVWGDDEESSGMVMKAFYVASELL